MRSPWIIAFTALAVLALPAPAQYPGHGCFPQGNFPQRTEACITWLSSESLAQIFPTNPGTDQLRANPWFRFLVSVWAPDEEVEAICVTLSYELDGRIETVMQIDKRWGNARSDWTSFAFFTQLGAKFVSVRVALLKPSETITANRENP